MLLIAGDGDVYCPPAEVRAFAAEFPMPPWRSWREPTTDLWRREREAAAFAGSFWNAFCGARPVLERHVGEDHDPGFGHLLHREPEALAPESGILASSVRHLVGAGTR